MGWFGKKDGKREGMLLPELPKIPELPPLGKSGDFDRITLPNLPSYPNSSFGKKFSQNAIKDAVSGEEEDEIEEDFDEDEFPIKGKAALEPLPGFVKRKTLPEEEYTSRTLGFKRSGKEPVFIRIDKYDDALRMFEDAKKKIMEMEDMLKHIKKIKEDEYRELKEWESETQKIKEDFERVNRDIFSKL